jgi:hypothetical protein
MDKLVRMTLVIKAPTEAARAAWIAATRALRAGSPEPQRDAENDHEQLMSRNLMIVRALPCESY